ncbi:unnamed protein product [Urochloa humidicola]
MTARPRCVEHVIPLLWLVLRCPILLVYSMLASAARCIDGPVTGVRRTCSTTVTIGSDSQSTRSKKYISNGK